jgi:DNA repair ATPase RecN
MKYFFSILLFFYSFKTFSQAQELQQLALDLEKLTQFKQILSDMKKGYEILSGGYNTIKDISQGNFNLHKDFLDGLLAISPAVAKYTKIADIISMQLQLVKEYKSYYSRFKKDSHFTVNEVTYIGNV